MKAATSKRNTRSTTPDKEELDRLIADELMEDAISLLGWIDRCEGGDDDIPEYVAATIRVAVEKIRKAQKAIKGDARNG